MRSVPDLGSKESKKLLTVFRRFSFFSGPFKRLTSLVKLDLVNLGSL